MDNWLHKKEWLFGGGYASAGSNVIDTGITAAAAITGDYIQQQTQEQTNAANAAMNQSNQNFNAFQAVLGRDFNAQQTKNQMDFQQSMLNQTEAYDTTMSDTAMQRRMADNRAAGVNPLLAVSAGGASSPTVVGGSGSALAGPTASSPSMIPMQNPGAAFGSLGQQASSALQAGNLKSQADLNESQANLNNVKAGTEVPAQVDYLKALTGTTDAQAKQIATNIDLMGQQANEIGQRAELEGVQMALETVRTNMATQDLNVKMGTVQALKSAIQSDAAAKQLGLQALRTWAQTHTGDIGTILNTVNSFLQPVSSAVGIARGTGGFAGGTQQPQLP